jgi:polyisoprenoid-binding protein YceI
LPTNQNVPVASPIPQFGLLPEGHWRIDPSRSRLEFSVRKLGAGTVHGRFADADGHLVVEAGQASASGSVRVASIATGSEDRDAHLRAAGFFAADAYPEIAFASRAIVPDDERGYRICGDLTIRGQTREVELIAALPVGPDVQQRIEVRGQIDRRDFGLTWNRAIEMTGAVSTTVRIELDLQLVRARPLP